jgi:TatA/E family protein of Tat protein translocase
MFESLAQPMHLFVILVIGLLFFGLSKFADFGRGLGQGIRGFTDALKDEPVAPTQPPAPTKEEWWLLTANPIS